MAPAAAAATAAGPSGDAGGVKLKKSITLFSGITMIVGSVIGSGIFVSPTGVLLSAGSVGASLLVWLLCGVYSTVGAYCYAELGTMIVRSGGDYAYILEAFGPFLAFLRMWVECIVIRPGMMAIQALTFAYYITEPIFPGCDAKPSDAVRLLAAFSIVGLTLVNCASVKLATRVQDAFAVAKTLALTTIILTGFVRLGQGHTKHFSGLFEVSIDKEINTGTIALAFYSGLFAFTGWNNLNLVMEEVQNPRRNLPVAIWVSLISCTLLYFFTNVAYFTTISPMELIDSPAVAVTFAQRLYGPVWWVMPIFVSFSTFGGMNGNILASSRIYFAAARDGQLPRIVSGIQMNKLTPLIAVALPGIMSCIYLVTADIYVLINYCGFVTWLAVGLSVLTLFYFRKMWPNANRPLKISLVWPVLYTIMTVFILVVPVVASPYDTGMGILIVLTGVPVYAIFVAWKKKPKALRNLNESATRLLQKLFVIVPDVAAGDQDD